MMLLQNNSNSLFHRLLIYGATDNPKSVKIDKRIIDRATLTALPVRFQVVVKAKNKIQRRKRMLGNLNIKNFYFKIKMKIKI